LAALSAVCGKKSFGSAGPGTYVWEILVRKSSAILKKPVLSGWRLHGLISGDVIRMSMKLLLIGLVFAAAHFDLAMSSGTFIDRDAAVWFYLANEGLSILENMTLAGVPFPRSPLEYVFGVSPTDGIHPGGHIHCYQTQKQNKCSGLFQ